MKMMDEVAGIVAFRHCKSNVVTASIGKFLIVKGQKCYCCNLSMNSSKQFTVHDNVYFLYFFYIFIYHLHVFT